MNDEEFRAIWRYTHLDLVARCKDNIIEFRQDKKFNEAKKVVLNDMNCVYKRRLDSRNSISASQKFYTEFALDRIKDYYESH